MSQYTPFDDFWEQIVARPTLSDKPGNRAPTYGRDDSPFDAVWGPFEVSDHWKQE